MKLGRLIVHICKFLGVPSLFLWHSKNGSVISRAVWSEGHTIFFLICNCIFWSMHVVNLYFAVTTIAISQNKMLLLAPCCFLYDLISPPCLFIMTSNLPEAKKNNLAYVRTSKIPPSSSWDVSKYKFSSSGSWLQIKKR